MWKVYIHQMDLIKIKFLSFFLKKESVLQLEFWGEKWQKFHLYQKLFYKYTVFPMQAWLWSPISETNKKFLFLF